MFALYAYKDTTGIVGMYGVALNLNLVRAVGVFLILQVKLFWAAMIAGGAKGKNIQYSSIKLSLFLCGGFVIDSYVIESLS